MREKYYVALSNINGYHWEIFQARPDQATAEQTGYVAVGEGYDTQAEALEMAHYLNAVMFNLATYGLSVVHGGE